MRFELGDVSLDLQPFGAMITGARFRLPNGTVAEPFFFNHWRDDSSEEFDQLEPFLQKLGGEWACVPFGTPGTPGDLPSDWQVAPAKDWNQFIHGMGSHRDWELEHLAPNLLVATIDYPDDTPVSSLRRTISLEPDTLTLRIGLKIEPRERLRVAVGMHSVFDLTGCSPASCEIRPSGTDTAWSFPIDVEPGRSKFLPDQRGVSLKRAAASDHSSIDGTRVPFADMTEDLLMLTNPGGEVSLFVPEKGYQVDVRWNAEHFPSCSLWYSNGGRLFYPWNGQVRAIGIEPTNAAFNLGQTHSLSKDTPLSRNNITTFIEVDTGTPWETEYSISVLPI